VGGTGSRSVEDGAWRLQIRLERAELKEAGGTIHATPSFVEIEGRHTTNGIKIFRQGSGAYSPPPAPQTWIRAVGECVKLFPAFRCERELAATGGKGDKPAGGDRRNHSSECMFTKWRL